MGTTLEDRLRTAERERDQLKALFDLHWKAEQRGIAMWQAATGRDRTLPDVAHFTSWLIDRLERAEAVIDVARQLGEPASCEHGVGNDDAISIDVALHITAYDKANASPNIA